MTRAEPIRESGFRAESPPTVVDRFGVWLSGRSIRRAVPSFDGLRLADLGCGHHATFSRSVLEQVESVLLVDVSLADDLKLHPKITSVEGTLPDALADVPSASVDVVMCISSLEHVSAAESLARECHRLLAPGGTFLVNVPTWLGKRFLEFSAFRLALSPAEEMDDHKMYYDQRDLWPLLRRAGFLPHNIRCYRHKGGLNLFAVCRVEGTDR